MTNRTVAAHAEDVAIDSTGTLLELDTGGRTELSLSIEGTASADYELECRPTEGAAWRTVGTYASTTEELRGYTGAVVSVRLKVTTAASAGATADVSLTAA